MSVRKRKGKSSVVPRGWRIKKPTPIHIDYEPAFVNALFVLIDKYRCLRRRGRDNISLFAEHPVFIFARERYTAHPRVNAVTAHPRLSAGHAFVRWAMINTGRRVVRPKCPQFQAIHVRRIEHPGLYLSESR